MNIAVISFTDAGRKLSLQMKDLSANVKLYCKQAGFPTDSEIVEKVESNLKEWTKIQFHEKDVLIFIGATGIAVRAIAPFVKDKKTDPAVLVLDEQGRYCIPLLSGHIGGANEIASLLEQKIGTEAVITTATDINQTMRGRCICEKMI